MCTYVHIIFGNMCIFINELMTIHWRIFREVYKNNSNLCILNNLYTFITNIIHNMRRTFLPFFYNLICFELWMFNFIHELSALIDCKIPKEIQIIVIARVLQFSDLFSHPPNAIIMFSHSFLSHSVKFINQLCVYYFLLTINMM